MIDLKLLLPIIALTVLGHSAWAQGDPDVDDSPAVELLSYTELLDLSSEQRIQYIQGVRLILVELSKNADGRFSDSDPGQRSRLKAWLDLLNDQLKMATAEEMEPTTRERPRRRLRITSATSTSFASSRPYATKQEFVDSLVGSTGYNCVSKFQSPRSTAATAELKPCSENAERRIEAAFQEQKPLIAVGRSSGVNVSSAGAVEGSVEGPIAAPLVVPSIELKAATPAEVSSSLAPVNADVGDVRRKISRKFSEEEIQQWFDKNKNLNDICKIESEKLKTSAMDLVQTEDGSRYCMTVAGEALYRKGILKLDATGDSTDSTIRVAPKKTMTSRLKTSAASKNFSCAPKPVACENPKVTHDKVFTGNLQCVFAGMFSTLEKSNRKCKPVTEFKVGAASYKCEPGQTMCNPLLFGAVSSSKPICVGRGFDATLQCSKLSSARDAEKFLNRNESGLLDHWDRFKADLENVCKPGSLQARFHCVECNVMKTRLFELRTRVVGNPCSSSDDALRNHVKSRNRESPTNK